ncbi:ORC-CDC6 family AAA ATPase [Bradyrhizobium liaoningense]
MALTEGQQRYVQSLIRERRAPATFRIGSRLYGIKTLETYSDEEINREGSEFKQIVLDHRLRQNSEQWDSFADQMVRRRLQVFGALTERSVSVRTIEYIFENPDLSWDSDAVFKMIGSPPPGTGRHFDRLHRVLKEGLSQGRAPGISTQRDIDHVAKVVALPGRPILEKINMLSLYQGWYRNHSLPKLAEQIATQAADFAAGKSKGAYSTRVQHYASDMVAQLLRDEGKQIPLQFGLKNFVRMAEGLPRTLVVALRNIWDLAIYNEREEIIDRISKEDQANGLLDTAEWFMQTMRKPGADGTAVRTAIERIARLFETNRFADKPVECSLLGFAVLERELTEKTQSLLLVAEQRSFLIRTTREEIDRNSQERLAKFQLNATLAPKWSLPIARRGIVKFSPAALDLIFDPARAGDFEEFHKAWRAKMTAPLFGGARKQEAHQAMPSLFEPDE